MNGNGNGLRSRSHLFTGHGSAWIQLGADIDGEAAGDAIWHICFPVCRWPDRCDWRSTSMMRMAGDSGHVRIYSLDRVCMEPDWSQI